MGELRYAVGDGLHLAYRLLDGGEVRDIVLFTPGGTIPMDALERDRVGARLVRGLAAIGRLVLFDRRGIGLSDPISDWDRPLVEQWADDLATVVDAADLDHPVVVSLGDYWGPARLFAGRDSAPLGALVLYEPQGPSEAVDLRGGVHLSGQLRPPDVGETADDWLALVCPSRAHDAGFRQWFDMSGRTGASPAVAARLYDRPADPCVRGLVEAQRRIAAPTLVLRRPGNLLGSPPLPDPVVSAIPGSRRVDLPGRDYHWLGEDVDALLAEVSRFLTGEARLPAPERELCAILFTDLVGSTQLAVAVGDRRWAAVLARHDAVIREEVDRSGGAVVKTTGDGVLATLPSGDRALRAAAAIRSRLHNENLEVRIGIHVGDVERRGDDLTGVGVHVAARVMALAGSGEILVSSTVPGAVMGTADRFEPKGRQVLRGVPGEWDLHSYLEPSSTRA
jgi:class 3 adenylate cyclase